MRMTVYVGQPSPVLLKGISQDIRMIDVTFSHCILFAIGIYIQTRSLRKTSQDTYDKT